MTLERGWKARQEAAVRKAALRDKMHELNRARASVIGSQVNPQTIVPIFPEPAPEPAPAPESAVDADQFDPAVDASPESTTPAKGRKKA